MRRKIAFGGGCHWCTEAIFQALHGVELAEQGWISSVNPYDSFSESVIVHFDKGITMEMLIEVHLLTHSSSSAHSMREKYRSAVYYFDPDDKDIIESIISELAKQNNTNYITRTLLFADFRLNTENYLSYYKRQTKAFLPEQYQSQTKSNTRKIWKAGSGRFLKGKNCQNIG